MGRRSEFADRCEHGWRNLRGRADQTGCVGHSDCRAMPHGRYLAANASRHSSAGERLSDAAPAHDRCIDVLRPRIDGHWKSRHGAAWLSSALRRGSNLDAHASQVQSTGFVVVERTVRLPTPLTRSGIDCAPLVRAVLDAARRCKTLDSARALIADVVQRGDVVVRDLSKELEAGSIRGSALPRKVLREVDANVHSVPEAEARELWRRTGLPEMVFNREICDANGKFIAMPDGGSILWLLRGTSIHWTGICHLGTTGRRSSVGLVCRTRASSCFRLCRARCAQSPSA